MSPSFYKPTELILLIYNIVLQERAMLFYTIQIEYFYVVRIWHLCKKQIKLGWNYTSEKVKVKNFWVLYQSME